MKMLSTLHEILVPGEMEILFMLVCDICNLVCVVTGKVSFLWKDNRENLRALVKTLKQNHFYPEKEKLIQINEHKLLK